jgi:hypothetical protein
VKAVLAWVLICGLLLFGSLIIRTLATRRAGEIIMLALAGVSLWLIFRIVKG